MIHQAKIRLRAAWANLSLRNKGLVFIAIPVTMLLVTVAAAYLTQRYQAEAQKRVLRTLQVEAKIHEAHLLLVETETRARGYLLTERQDFLPPYEKARQELPRALAELGDLVQDNPAQTERLRHIQSTARKHTEELAALVAKYQATPIREALSSADALLLGQKEILDTIRTELEAMHSEEQSLLTQGSERFRRLSAGSNAVMILGALFGLLGGAFAALLFSNGVVTRVRLLEENARRLSEELPLISPQSGNDELGRLEQGLQAASLLLAVRGQALRTETERLSAEVVERQRAEEELRETQRHLEAAIHANQLIMEHSLDVICIVDAEGRFTTVSAACEKLWGYTQAELAGRRYIDLVYPEDHAATNAIAARIVGGQPTNDFENRYIRKDGSLVPVTWSAYWSEGDQSMFAVARDNTERKRAEEAMQQARALADRANAAKSEFLSRMSHELRTPLNAILGFAQLLEMDAEEDEERDNIDQILKGGRHLLELINEVLDISRIEAGRLSISPEPVRLSEVLSDAVQLIRPLAAQREIRLEGDFLETCTRHVFADRQRLKQVVLNLLSNAVKYNRPAGAITISCHPAPAERLRLDITDTGYGLAPAEIERLFGAFERLDADRNGIGGTGLGLALSKRLIELMGGEIGVESTVGQGTTFWIKLPQVPSPLESHEAAAPSVQNPETKNQNPKTVLYIEDNLLNLKLIERIMVHRSGIKLIPAMQGNLGLELAREHHPDLVLLDLNLPDIPGSEVLRRLRGEEPTRNTPVIIVSADATPGEIERMLAAGASGYLTKPLDVQSFLTTLDGALRANGANPGIPL